MNEINLFSQDRDSGALRLSELTLRISNSVNSDPKLSNVWVTAELSDVRVSAGHCYLELIEKSETGQTLAKIRATIWQSNYRRLREKFFSVTSREISTGMKVMVKGSANHHSLYGLAFNVVDIEPSYTLGDIERIRREILQRLEKENIINKNKELGFPLVPRRIAVISAEGAAGLGDFLKQLTENEEGFIFYPFLFPAIMQGEKVSFSVCQALDLIELTIDLWDCVVILRGGGATTDLIGFDDYNLARKVATFPLPVIVGIGHERDRTVLDEIACVRVKTPTAAAALLINTLRQTYDKTLNLVDFITRYASDRIAGEKNRISNIGVALPALVKSKITAAEALIKQEFLRIPMSVEVRIKKELAKIDSFIPLLQNITSYKSTIEKNILKGLKEKIVTESQRKIFDSKQLIERYRSIIQALDPNQTLKRGYTIIRQEEKLVGSCDKLKEDSEINITFYNGVVKAHLLEVKK